MAKQLTKEQIAKGTAYLKSLPGKRGIDIPSDIFDTLRSVADGAMLPVWGRRATPHQLQALHDAGAHTPAAIHQAIGQLPHPQAPDMSLSDYSQYSQGLDLFNKNRGGRNS